MFAERKSQLADKRFIINPVTSVVELVVFKVHLISLKLIQFIIIEGEGDCLVFMLIQTQICTGDLIDISLVGAVVTFWSL